MAFLVAASASPASLELLCATEIALRPQIRAPGGELMMLYSDATLAAYLTTMYERVSRQEGRAVVLPVYSPRAVWFTKGHVVFVATALLLSLRSEGDVLSVLARIDEVVAKSRRSSPTRVMSSHYDNSPPANSLPEFEELRESLARSLERYEEWLRPKLKVRLRESQPIECPTAAASGDAAEAGWSKGSTASLDLHLR